MTRSLKMTLKSTLTLAALVAVTALPAADFKSSMDLQLGGDYSELQDGPGALGIGGQAMIVPMWKLGSSDYLVPALYATDNGRSAVLNTANPTVEYFSSSIVLTAEPVWKHYFQDTGWVSGVYGQAIHNYNQDNVGEVLGQGLYDNEIYGGGVQLSNKELADWLKFLSVDISYNHWHFPNYNSGKAPGSLNLDYNYYVLDMDVIKANLNFALPMSLSLDYTLSDRNYGDSYSYSPDGTLTSDSLSVGNRNPLRHDMLSVLKLGWTRSLDEHWAFSAVAEGDYQASNFDYFNYYAAYWYYDYYSYRKAAFIPSLSWMPKGNPKGDTVVLSWTMQYLDYLHRSIFNPDGTPTMGTEDDFENTVSLFARKMIWGPLGAYVRFTDDMSQSNQSLMGQAPYNYSIFDGQLGFEYQY
jgi:hypothetical protein